MKEELGEGRVGVGITGVEQDEEVEEEEDGDEEVLATVLPRMSSM